MSNDNLLGAGYTAGRITGLSYALGACDEICWANHDERRAISMIREIIEKKLEEVKSASV